MKPLFALLAFMTCILSIYYLPTPDPSAQIDCLEKQPEPRELLFDQTVEFVEHPLEISIP